MAPKPTWQFTHTKGIGSSRKKTASYPSHDHGALAEIIRKFLSGDHSDIRQACFGVAGPVKGGVVEVTNLPWIVDAAALQAELNFQQVSLLNDLEANAYGINTLFPNELLSLNPQANPRQVGNRAPSSPRAPAWAKRACSGTA